MRERDSNKNSGNRSSGIGFVGLLQILFIALKLLDKIQWSWWAVLIPAFFSIGIVIFALIILIVVAIKD